MALDDVKEFGLGEMVEADTEVPSDMVPEVPETEYHSLSHTEFMKTRPGSESAVSEMVELFGVLENCRSLKQRLNGVTSEFLKQQREICMGNLTNRELRC